MIAAHVIAVAMGVDEPVQRRVVECGCDGFKRCVRVTTPAITAIDQHIPVGTRQHNLVAIKPAAFDDGDTGGESMEDGGPIIG